MCWGRKAILLDLVKDLGYINAKYLSKPKSFVVSDKRQAAKTGSKKSSYWYIVDDEKKYQKTVTFSNGQTRQLINILLHETRVKRGYGILVPFRCNRFAVLNAKADYRLSTIQWIHQGFLHPTKHRMQPPGHQHGSVFAPAQCQPSQSPRQDEGTSFRADPRTYGLFSALHQLHRVPPLQNEAGIPSKRSRGRVSSGSKAHFFINQSPSLIQLPNHKRLKNFAFYRNLREFSPLPVQVRKLLLPSLRRQ